MNISSIGVFNLVAIGFIIGALLERHLIKGGFSKKKTLSQKEDKLNKLKGGKK